MTADYGDGWAEDYADRMQQRRMAYVYGEPSVPRAPYPDGLRQPPAWHPADQVDDPDGRHYYDDDPAPRDRDPGELLAWMARHKRDTRLRDYDEAAASVERSGPTLDGEAARRMLAVSRNRDGSPADVGEMHARVTEFRAQWQKAGTTQVRTGPW
jgi:hypothetical protein